MVEIKKQEMTVQWIVNRKDKKLIKFVEGEDRTYKLADNVISHIDEIAKRKTNVPVNVSIDGDNVVFIALRGAQAETKAASQEEKKTEEVKQEEKPVETSKEESKKSSTKSVTVNYYSKDKMWWVFLETGEKTWLGIDESLVEFMKTVNKGDVLEISGESRKSKGKDIDFITSAKLVTKAQTSSENKKEEQTYTQKKSYGRDETATDKRTALMVAKDIIVVLIQEKSMEKKQLKEALMDLTKVCYDALQSI